MLGVKTEIEFDDRHRVAPSQCEVMTMCSGAIAIATSFGIGQEGHLKIPKAMSFGVIREPGQDNLGVSVFQVKGGGKIARIYSGTFNFNAGMFEPPLINSRVSRYVQPTIRLAANLLLSDTLRQSNVTEILGGYVHGERHQSIVNAFDTTVIATAPWE